LAQRFSQDIVKSTKDLDLRWVFLRCFNYKFSCRKQVALSIMQEAGTQLQSRVKVLHELISRNCHVKILMNKKLICCREVVQCAVSLNMMLS